MIQTIGRAARNEHGRVIMYADVITRSMQAAIDETARRRAIQEAFNKEHGITPKTIKKELRELIVTTKVAEETPKYQPVSAAIADMAPPELEAKAREMEKEMQEAAKALDFERAALLRDQLILIKGKLGQRMPKGKAPAKRKR